MAGQRVTAPGMDDAGDVQTQKPTQSLVKRLLVNFGLAKPAPSARPTLSRWEQNKLEKKKLKENEELLAASRIAAKLAALAAVEEEKQRLRELEEKERARYHPFGGNVPMDEMDEKLLADLNMYIPAQKIQKRIRGFLARQVKKRNRWKDAVNAAEKYYEDRETAVQFKMGVRRRGIIVRQTFAHTYVRDVLATARLAILQAHCVIKLQRLWRGFRCRKRLAKRFAKLRREKMFPKNKSGITAETARRVWARTEFVPSGGVKGQKILEYDMLEYADRPPQGRDFGLKTFKVVASARNEREKKVVLKDPAAWVGLPVLVEPHAVWVQREREKKEALMMLTHTTPYAEHRTVYIPPKPKPQGMALLRSLGWNEGLIDKELRVVPPREETQRLGFVMVNPLDAHKVADMMDGMYLPDAMHKRMRAKVTVGVGGKRVAREFKRLGALSQESSISLGIGTLSPSKSTINSKPSSPLRQHISSTNLNSNSFILPAAEQDVEAPTMDLLGGVGAVRRMVTPLRGAMKPLPRAHRLALEQHELLPSQVQHIATRTATQGFEDSHWRHTAWGGIKQRAEDFARAERGLNKLRKLDEESTLTLTEHLEKQLGADPWTRQLYRPKIPVPCRIEAFPMRARKHFKLRYSWLPQPLVKQAANRVLNDDRDFHRRSYLPEIESTAFLTQESEQEQEQKQEQEPKQL